ncbi:MAG: hypothetical protein AABO58_19485 [Acidobacteriota bacterium]
MSIRVHIERLVLDGLPIAHRDGPLVQAAVEAELARLLAQRTPALSGGATPRVAAPSIAAAPDAADLGREIARAVYGGIES